MPIIQTLSRQRQEDSHKFLASQISMGNSKPTKNKNYIERLASKQANKPTGLVRWSGQCCPCNYEALSLTPRTHRNAGCGGPSNGKMGDGDRRLLGVHRSDTCTGCSWGGPASVPSAHMVAHNCNSSSSCPPLAPGSIKHAILHVYTCRQTPIHSK